MGRSRERRPSAGISAGAEGDGSGLDEGSGRLEQIDAAHCGQQTRTHLHGDAGERGGARVGKLKWARNRAITGGSSMAALCPLLYGYDDL